LGFLFAKTGDPDSAGGLLWPKWTNDKEDQIEFTADGPKLREHFLKAWCDLAESLVGE
jgi:hypothetical protein